MRQDTNPTQDYKIIDLKKKTLNIFTHVLKRAMEVKLHIYVSTYIDEKVNKQRTKMSHRLVMFFLKKRHWLCVLILKLLSCDT